MLIIDADETRLIDLPGPGPCPRPVDIDQSVTGFQRLKSLRLYRFQPGPPIHGDSESDEVFILPLTGALDIAITGAHPLSARLSADGPTRALYMTPDHSYALTPLAPTLVAYARAEAAGSVAVQALGGRACGNIAEQLRYWRITLAPGEALSLAGEALVYVISGALTVAVAGQTVAIAAGADEDLRAPVGAEVLVVSE